MHCLNFMFFQALLVGIPLVSILRTVSTDGRYIGLVLLIAIFSLSSVIMIMLPKVLAFYNIYGGQTARRGARQGVRVTGTSSGAAGSAATRPSSELNDYFSNNGSSNNKHSDLEAIPESGRSTGDR